MPIMDIATHRLHLVETYRPVEEHITWLNDKDLMKWSEQRYLDHDFDTQREFLNGALLGGDPRVWDIRCKPVSIAVPEPYSIGSIHAYCNERHKRVDLGIMLGPQYHGYGYATEAWNAIYNYLGVKEGVRKFEAGCVDGNTGIIKMLMRLGWTVEGRRENHFIIDGKSYGLVQFGKVFS